MGDRRTRPTRDDEEAMMALGDLLAADRLLDAVIAYQRDEDPAKSPDDGAGDDEVVTDGVR